MSEKSRAGVRSRKRERSDGKMSRDGIVSAELILPFFSTEKQLVKVVIGLTGVIELATRGEEEVDPLILLPFDFQ